MPNIAYLRTDGEEAVGRVLGHLMMTRGTRYPHGPKVPQPKKGTLPPPREGGTCYEYACKAIDRSLQQ